MIDKRWTLLDRSKRFSKMTEMWLRLSPNSYDDETENHFPGIDERAKIDALRSSGLSLSEIAKLVGCSKSTVKRTIDRIKSSGPWRKLKRVFLAENRYSVNQMTST